MYGMPCECMHGLKGGVQKLRRPSLARAVYDNPTPPPLWPLNDVSGDCRTPQCIRRWRPWPLSSFSGDLLMAFLWHWRHKCLKQNNRISPMRLSAPSFIVFVISLICGALAVLPVFGVAVVALPISGFWLMTIAWGLLLAGVLFRGV